MLWNVFQVFISQNHCFDCLLRYRCYLQPEDDDVAPDVERLRQEVANLRKDVDTIRSTMQDMHREVKTFEMLQRPDA